MSHGPTGPSVYREIIARRQAASAQAAKPQAAPEERRVAAIRKAIRKIRLHVDSRGEVEEVWSCMGRQLVITETAPHKLNLAADAEGWSDAVKKWLSKRRKS